MRGSWDSLEFVGLPAGGKMGHLGAGKVRFSTLVSARVGRRCPSGSLSRPMAMIGVTSKGIRRRSARKRMGHGEVRSLAAGRRHRIWASCALSKIQLPSFHERLPQHNSNGSPVHALVGPARESRTLFRFLSTFPKTVKTYDWRQTTRLRGVATCFRRFDHIPPGEPDATI